MPNNSCRRGDDLKVDEMRVTVLFDGENLKVEVWLNEGSNCSA